ncbi:hypothetical protein TNCV_1866031 [Trichonephila clavipes]|nr:hypothetical protein TNCV_1866031 [Trichonephila clavipes]
MLLGSQPPGFLPVGPLEIVCEGGGVGGCNLDSHAGIVVALADIVSTPDLFERVRQFFVRLCRLCMVLAFATSKKFL